MKSDKSFDEIGDLLRSGKPDCSPPPGLEMRILRALDERQHPASKSWWPWLLLPPAFAALAALVFVMRPLGSPQESEIAAHPSSSSPTGSSIAETDSAGSTESVVSLAAGGDPLRAESDALRRDVQRAGDFLINCLPSIASAVE